MEISAKRPSFLPQQGFTKLYVCVLGTVLEVGWGFRNGKNACLQDHPERILPRILLLINIILHIMPNVQMRLMDIEEQDTY